MSNTQNNTPNLDEEAVNELNETKVASKPILLTKSQLRNLLILEIVSVSPYPEHVNPLTSKERSEVYAAFKNNKSWHDVFLPIRDIDLRKKYTDLFEELDKNEDIPD